MRESKDMISIQASSVTKKLHREYYHASNDDNKFFEDLLKKLSLVRLKGNLDLFLKHNYKFVLPKYSFKIVDNSKVIFDDKNCPICESVII